MSGPEIFIALICGVNLAIAIYYLVKKGLKEYHLTNLKGSVVLAGQLNHGPSSAQLPNPLGTHIYRITVNGGKLRLNHHTFNPDGGTWTLPPDNGEDEYFDISDGALRIFKITIGESYEHTDQVEIVNPSLRENVQFSYEIDRYFDSL